MKTFPFKKINAFTKGKSSGNPAFGYYLLQKNLWDGRAVSIEQNNNRDCPNLNKLDTVKQHDKINVIFGGAAQVKIEGTYNLP